MRFNAPAGWRLGLALALVLALMLPAPALAAPPLHTYTRAEHHMGSRFTFTVVAADSATGQRALRAAFAEVGRLDHLLSFWDSASVVTQINRLAGVRPVAVDAETFALFQRTRRLGQLSRGAFDITFASADKLYKFDRQAHPALPDSAAVRASVRRIGYQKIRLDSVARTVGLPERGMRLNLAGILQGYAIRRARQVLTGYALGGGLLNGSGDILCWGRQADGSRWRVAIGDPDHPRSIAAWVDVTDVAVVTAGNYEQFFTVGGRVYGHILDPRTGYPATGLRSVTIVCPDVELADGLDEIVFVQGPVAGLAFINGLRGVECALITDDNQILVSKGLKTNYYRGTSTKP